MIDTSETIKGSYVIKTMPDGQDILFEKLSNGKWVMVEDRITHETNRIEKTRTPTEIFDKRFEGTDTYPSNWDPQTSGRLKPKKIAFDILIKTSKTHAHLHAHLIEILGQPEDIIKNKKMFKNITDPSIRRMVTKMIESLDADIWNEVLKIMNHEQ